MSQNIENAAIRWMYDMELVNNPSVLNSLYLNIYSQSKCIKDVELIIDSTSRKIMVFIDIPWYKKVFRSSQKKIAEFVIHNLNELLPRYQVRVTTNKEIFNKSKDVVTNSFKGGLNENTDTSSNTDVDNVDSRSSESSE